MKKHYKKILICFMLIGIFAVWFQKAHADSFGTSLLWWTFDNRSISGTSLTDYSGNANTGTLTSSPVTGGVGKQGQDLYCNNAGYVTDSSLASITGDTQNTFAVWFRRPSTGSVIQIQQGTNSNTNLYGPTIYSDGNIYFDMDGPVNNQYGKISTNDTKWHFYVMVFNGSLTGNSARMKIYLDGVLQSPSYNNTIPSAVPTLTGGLQVCKATAGGSLSTGYVDDLRIWSTALTANQVAALYYSSFNGFGR